MRNEAMSRIEAVPDPVDPWESGQLGRDCEQVEKATAELVKEVEASLEMQMISIRFPKQLIDELKLIAHYRGIGYQPLIRDVAARFARAEILLIAQELQEQEQARATIQAEIESRKVG
jgi:predicted DNA binding CopG/RHH family protein